jgi:hypothetical protein
MRFMMLVKGVDNMGLPPKALLDAIDKSTAEALKAGTMITAGGLLPIASGARVRLSKGKVTVTDGPFTEAKELIGGFAIFEFKSKQEAIASAQELMQLHKELWPGWEGETEVREMMDQPPGAR